MNWLKPKSPISLMAMAAILFASPVLSAELPIPTKRPVIIESTEDIDPLEASPPAIRDEPKASSVDSQTKQCLKALENLGAQFEILPTIADDGDCGIQTPVSVSVFADNVALIPRSELSCETALAVSKWIKASVIPAAQAAFPKDKLSGIAHGSTYVCRTRNRVEGAKLSEHAKGSAIDIMGFQFESGKSIAIEPRQRTGNLDESFQKAVRFGACLYFTTVLGPFSDENHKDHLHLDIAERNGGYRLCDFPDLPTIEISED